MTPPRDGIARRIALVAVPMLVLFAAFVALMSVFGHALPSAGLVAYAIHHGDVRDIDVLDVARGQRVRLASSSEGQTPLVWSSDGQQVAFFSGETTNVDLYVKRLDSQFPQQLTDTNDEKFSLAWSPDGQQIAYLSTVADRANPAVYVLNVNTRALMPVDSDRVLPVTQPVWSPDGHWLAATAIRGGALELVVYPSGSTTGEPSAAREAGILPPSLAWSPDSRWLIYSMAGPELNDGYVLYALDTIAGQQRILADEPGNVAKLVWSPDAHWLAILSRSVSAWTISLLDVTCLKVDTVCKSNFVTLIDNADSQWLSWSPDNRWLLYANYRSLTEYDVSMVNVACSDNPASCKSRAVALVDGADSPVWQPRIP